MSSLHFLNVKNGDCHLIRHPSRRVTMMDICNGHAAMESSIGALLGQYRAASANVGGNFQMKENPTQPLDYLKSIGVTEVFRFILSHPDMDHMDGLDPLVQNVPVMNFWDSGARKPKPDFGPGCPYKKEDWERYELILRGQQPGMQVMRVQAGAQFAYANEPVGGSDGLHILAPDAHLIQAAGEDANDASYVVLYRVGGLKILLPGDAHDQTWAHLLRTRSEAIRDCDILIAPHHGRNSDMDFSFLDVVNPQLVLIGNAPSDYLAYDKYRNYNRITNNQAGNVVVEFAAEGMDVFVENDRFAERINGPTTRRNSQKYAFLKHFANRSRAPVAAAQNQGSSW